MGSHLFEIARLLEDNQALRVLIAKGLLASSALKRHMLLPSKPSTFRSLEGALLHQFYRREAVERARNSLVIA